MPIEMNDSDNGLGIIFIGRGRITENEFLNAYEKHLTQNKDKYRKYKYGLHDYTEVTEIDVSTDTFRQIADFAVNASKINPDAITTLVASKDLTFGLGRMWEMLADETKWEIMVYRDREDAEVWVRQKLEAKFGISDITFI